ncbi:MAG: alginate export family protein [Deltaproteobacteria bacterium]|nr:alginate export family protein [Deltaproteobacteria bacterium]
MTKKIIITILAVLVMPHFVWTAEKAEGKASAWHEKVSVGGELRLRSESQLAYGGITGGVDNDSFVLSRARTHLDARPLDGLQVFIQPQFSRIFAQEESTIANNGDAANGNNVFDLHQGYLNFQKIGGSPFSLKVGRQELVYGDERLVGAFGWSNIGRSFDAGKLRLEWDHFWLDGFFAWNEKAGGNEYFSGLYGSSEMNSSMTMEGYALLLRDNDGDGSALQGLGLTLATVGHRMVGNLLENRIDYNTEMAMQVGKTEPNNHLAHAVHAAAGYNFETSTRPRFGLEANYASGDDASTARIERFHNLFPTNHTKYGYIDFVGWQNVIDAGPTFSLKPFNGAVVSLDYHLFLLPRVIDGLFRAAGTQLRAGAGGASRLAGHEVDLLGKYQWNKAVNFLLGYSLFKGGEFFSTTGTNGTAHFLYTQTQVNF